MALAATGASDGSEPSSVRRGALYGLDRSVAAVDAAFFDGDGDPIVQPIWQGRWAASPVWAAEVELAAIFRGERGQVQAQMGNLSVATYRRWDTALYGMFELGGALVVPSATAETDGGLDGQVRADRIRGLSRWWLFGTERPATWVRFRHESHPGDEAVRLQAEVTPVLAFDTLRSEAEFGLSGALRASASRGPFELGLKFEGVMRVNDPTSSSVVGQVSLEPDLRVRWDAWSSGGPFAEIRLRINLDEPSGPSFDGGTYGLVLRLGAEF